MWGALGEAVRQSSNYHCDLIVGKGGDEGREDGAAYIARYSGSVGEYQRWTLR